MDKFETVDKKAKKKANSGAGANDGVGANGGRKFEKKFDGTKFNNNKENGAHGRGNKKYGASMPAPRAGERGDRRQDRGKTAAAPAAPVMVSAPVAKLEPVPNPAPIRPGGKTLADLVRGEPAAAAAPARPQGAGAAKGGVPRPQGGAGKPAPKVNGVNAGVSEPSFNGAATSEPVNWAKKVAGAQAPAAQAPVAQAPVVQQQQQRPPQPPQQPPQQARQAAPQPTSTDSFGFGFDASAQASAVPRPQQAMEQQAQDLGLQFGNFSTAGGDFGFGFDSSSQQSAAGWGMQQQQQQQRQPAAQAKRQPTSRNSSVASKLPDANSLNGSATTSGPDGQPVMPAYFGGMMPNAYANYMMPPAVPMAGGYAGYEGYQAAPAQTTTAQEGAYADYYKQQAAAQNAQAQAATGGASGDKSAGAQQMQAYANMPNAYGHPMYSYPYAMPHQPAYPYAVQSHYPYPPAAGVYPGQAPSKQSAGNAPPGYKAQDASAQQYAQGGQNVGGRDSQAAQYAEMQQGYYTQYASQYAANGYRQ